MNTAIDAEPATCAAGDLFIYKNAAVEAVLRKQLFFILGCQKSGTTWLQHLLNGHPEIACNGETVFVHTVLAPLNEVVKKYNKAQKIGQAAQLDGADAQYLFSVVFSLVLAKWGLAEGITCVGEKTPEHSTSAEMLATVFPSARFVHIVRDPRDIAVSGWFHNLRQKGDAFHKRFATLTDYARFIAKVHWPTMVGRSRVVRNAHPERYLELRYEDMLTEPEARVAEILTFLGVDAGAEAVGACLEAGSFKKLSGGRDSGSEDRGSFFRKGVAGDWKNHLDEAAAAVFPQYLGEAMCELGYEH
ncbi:MAG: sulfotransferase family protein [Phycisphaerales bacterium JB038]